MIIRDNSRKGEVREREGNETVAEVSPERELLVQRKAGNTFTNSSFGI